MSRQNWSDDKILNRLINNKTGSTYWENISVLRGRPSKELFTKCVKLIKSPNPNKKCIGIDILAQMGLPPRPFLKQTLELYFNLLKQEENANVIMSILYSIGHNNENLTKSQIEILCSFANTDDKKIKEGLISSLLGIEEPIAIQTLIKFSKDRLSNLRNWATFGIGSQIEKDCPDIRKALWDRINDKHQETKLEAILGLAKRNDDAIINIIKKELLEGEYGILLFEAILETKHKDFLVLLENNLKVGKENEINQLWLDDLEKCITELNQIVL